MPVDIFANSIELSCNPYCQSATNTSLVLLHHNANPLPLLAKKFLEGIGEELRTVLAQLQEVQSVLYESCQERVFNTEECCGIKEGLHDSYASCQATASVLAASEERFRSLICAIPEAVSVYQSPCDRIQERTTHLKTAFEQLSRGAFLPI